MTQVTRKPAVTEGLPLPRFPSPQWLPVPPSTSTMGRRQSPEVNPLRPTGAGAPIARKRLGTQSRTTTEATPRAACAFRGSCPKWESRKRMPVGKLREATENFRTSAGLRATQIAAEAPPRHRFPPRRRRCRAPPASTRLRMSPLHRSPRHRSPRLRDRRLRSLRLRSLRLRSLRLRSLRLRCPRLRFPRHHSPRHPSPRHHSPRHHSPRHHSPRHHSPRRPSLPPLLNPIRRRWDRPPPLRRWQLPPPHRHQRRPRSAPH